MGPFNAGRVDWSGDNPGIDLGNRLDEPWMALALFFRVVLSPHGNGRMALVLGEPNTKNGFPAAPNFCITDNDPLADYLIREFVSVFPTFRGAVGLGGATRFSLTGARTETEGSEGHSEFVQAADLDVELRWEMLGDPLAADIASEKSSTKRHRMYSVFRSAQAAKIVVNGRSLPGSVLARDFHGRLMTSALLAFSETWIVED